MSAANLTAAPQKQAGALLTQIRLFKGLPYGTKGKFWNAIAINLNSGAWSSDFSAPAVADTCETNWTRMLSTRVLQHQALKKKQARNAGNARACAAGGNDGEWESGAGDRDHEENAAAAPDVEDLEGNGVPSSKAKQEKIDSLLDAYLTQSAAFNGANGAASSAGSKKSGQPGEDLDEVEKASLGLTVKKAKKDPLPGPTSVERAQEHAMQQSSHFASSFSSIAESFKPDTQEVFESKAKAIAIHIGAPLERMVDVVVRANGEARVAQTTAFGIATENVIKALGTIYKEIEAGKRKCTSEAQTHTFTKVSDNPCVFLCSSCGFKA